MSAFYQRCQTNILIIAFQSTCMVSESANAHCLLFMLEKLKKGLDKGLTTGILLTDLNKAFDCMSHDILIAKLNACGLISFMIILVPENIEQR